MKFSLFPILSGGTILVLSVISLGLFVFGPPQIPLWYSLSLPEQQIDQKIFVFLFPCAALICCGLNFFFAKRVRKIDSSLETLFLYASFIPLIILSIACIHIVSVIL